MSWQLSNPMTMRLVLFALPVLVVLGWGMLGRPHFMTATHQPVVADSAPLRVTHSNPPLDDFTPRRELMVAQQLRRPHDGRRPITDPRVLEAMGCVPRHQFVAPRLQSQAYDDNPLPIGHGQTISQPYIVALMTEAVQPRPGHRALDIGTGSGYQAAVLAELVKDVYSIEIVGPLAREASERLRLLGYDNVEVRHGDGYQGWPEMAPFDVIVVAAAPTKIPQPLIDQLAVGGRLVIPVGAERQELGVLEKLVDGTLRRNSIAGVRFVPMTGEARP